MPDTKKLSSAEKRYRRLTVADVRVFSQILREQCDDLEQIAQGMEAIEIKDTQIDGAQKFVRGQRLLAEFVGRLDVALAKARAKVRADRMEQNAQERHE